MTRNSRAFSLCLLLGSSLGASLSWAQGTRFQNSATGTIKDNLPKPPPQEAQKIVYPKPGEMVFSGTLTCGDGDVDHYKKMNPGTDFFTDADAVAGLVLGVWIGDDTKNYTWIPFGTGELDIKNGAALKDLVALEGGAAQSAMALTQTKLLTLQQLSASTLIMKDTSKRRAYIGTQVCRPERVTATKPTVAQADTITIASSFASLLGTVQNEAQKHLATQFASMPVTVSAAPSGAAVSFGSGADAAQDPWAILANNISIAQYPAACKAAPTTCNYKQEMKAMKAFETLESLATSLAGAQNCAALSGLSSSHLWWEPWPMNLTCKLLASGVFAPGNFGSTSSAFSELVGYHGTISESRFIELRNSIAVTLASGGILRKIQGTFSNLKNSFKFPTCMADGSLLISSGNKAVESLVNSLVIGADSATTNPVQLQAQHPEPLFAIKQFKPYVDASQGNEYAIFGMRGNKDSDVKPLLQFVPGNPINIFPTLPQKAIQFRFKFRALGCCPAEPCFC